MSSLVSTPSATASGPARRSGPTATIDRLLAAAAAELDAGGYAELSVRGAAKRAAVSPATAYTWFASKDHLIAAVFLHLLHELPAPEVDGRRRVDERVRRVLEPLTDLLTARPQVAAAATTALLAENPDVVRIRLEVGRWFHDRLAVAVGPRPEVVRALDLALGGALLQAGLGLAEYAEVGGLVAEVAALIGTDRGGAT